MEESLPLARLIDPSLPAGWSAAVSVLSKVQRLWTAQRQAKIYRNPKNFLSLIGGHLLNLALPNSQFVKLAGLSLLAVRRLALLQEQLARTKKSYKQITDSAHLMFGSPHKGNNTLFRIKIVSRAALSFLSESGKTSASIASVVDTILSDCSKEAVTEIFVNTIENARWLGKNKKWFLSSFKEHEVTIKKIFQHLNVGITTEEVFSALETTLQGAEKMAAAADVINSNTAKRAVFGFASTFGVEQLLPDDAIEEEEEERKAYFILSQTIKLPKNIDKGKRFKVDYLHSKI